MRTGLIVVTQPLIDEVLTAVQAVRNPSSIYVSRRAIENEITAYPEKYPLLCDATRTFLRQIITKVMKRRYEFWSPERRNTFVWNITAPMEVSA